MNYKIILQYEGTRYDGWQRQKHTEQTIQGKLEQVLSRLAGETIEVNGAGRTDAGVHAFGQVANFHLDTELTDGELKKYLNRYLPGDVAVTGIERVPPRFHARLNACWKVYHYQIAFGEAKPVFERKLVYRVEEVLDFEKMEKAAKFLEGTHDFRAFCANKHMKKSTVRTVRRIGIQVHKKDGMASVTFTGDRFLYHMVRILMGTLLEVGMGKRRPEDMEALLESRDREQAGFTAPAQGLFLDYVSYDSRGCGTDCEYEEKEDD
ncbi:tRNA pseudouridine(38-40) synthase TruA [Lachnospiraceae bacterium LCP19S3_B12]